MSTTKVIAGNPLRTALAKREFVVAPGVFDMMSALVAERVGYQFIYASGYWTTASAYGLPDAGLVSYTQMLDRIQTLRQTVEPAIIADADTGFGGLLNVHHTVRGYEAAGVSAIQIEDQEFPKKCGHTPFKRVIGTQAMADKIKVAKSALRDPDGMMIIARTDALQSEGFDATIQRARAYGEAGADLLFVEAMTTIDEIKAACAALPYPLMINMAHGGKTPILTPGELAEIGYSAAIYPAMAALVATAAIEKAFRTLAEGRLPDAENGEIFSFDAFNRMIGFEEVWSLEKQWADHGMTAT